jgi:citrate lyase subunit beta/citryl-CoA lyase
MSTAAFAPRSLLFVPGNRADMIGKASRWAPDALVVDLEDAVPAGEKPAARASVVAGITELDRAGLTVLVRVNPASTPWFADDVRAALDAGADGVVLPKYEHRAEVAELRRLLPAGALIVVGLETAGGVLACRDLLGVDEHAGADGHAGADAVYFGAEDYIADLGGRRTVAGAEVLYARSEVRLAARVAGIAAVDQAVVAIRDDQRFVLDAEQGRAIGYTGKICVHPAQVALAHQVFSPTPEELDHARAVLRAAADGVGVVDGQMVDEVHVRMARTVLSRAPERMGGP